MFPAKTSWKNGKNSNFGKKEVARNVAELKTEHLVLIQGQEAQHEKALAEEKRKWEDKKKKYKDEVKKLSLLLKKRNRKGNSKSLMTDVEEKAKQVGVRATLGRL